MDRFRRWILSPSALAVDGAGNVYIADPGTNSAYESSAALLVRETRK